MIPFSVVIAFFLAAWLMMLLSWMVRAYLVVGKDSWIGWLQYYVVSPGMCNYIAILFGCEMEMEMELEPSHKFITSLLIGFIFIVVSGGAIYIYVAVEHNFAMFVAMLAAIVGAVAAIYQSKKDEENNSSISATQNNQLQAITNRSTENQASLLK